MIRTACATMASQILTSSSAMLDPGRCHFNFRFITDDTPDMAADLVLCVELRGIEPLTPSMPWINWTFAGVRRSLCLSW